MSAEEKAKGIVFEWGDKAVSSLDPEDIPTLERSITAALLEAFAEGKRQSLSAEQERQAEARGRREERERCAKECDRWADNLVHGSSAHRLIEQGYRNAASGIRSLTSQDSAAREEGENKCQICGAVFPRFSPLQRHLAGGCPAPTEGEGKR